MVLRLTARDGQGGVSSDDITVTVDGDKGPFQLIAPNGGETLGATATVTCDVAGTDAVPVSTDTVEFYLSTDGGTNFDVGPFGATSNTGSATVAFPAGINTATARIDRWGRTIFITMYRMRFFPLIPMLRRHRNPCSWSICPMIVALRFTSLQVLIMAPR